jgi:hypothetical protein
MASIDLEDLVPDLVIELNTPGTNIYGAVSVDEWVSRLRNAFWEAHLNGFMEGWTESEGLISKLNDPTAAAMTRDQQQLIILHAGMNVVRSELRTLNTSESYKAGPVAYEVQKSSQVLRALLDDMTKRMNYLLQRLADTGIARDIYYINSYVARQESINSGFTPWVGN